MPAFMHPCYSLAFVIEPSTTKGDQPLPVKRLFRSSAAASTTGSSLASGGSWKLILTEQRSSHGAGMYVQVELKRTSGQSNVPIAPPMLPFKSFSIQARETRFTLLSKNIAKARQCPLSLQAMLDPKYILDRDGQYAFLIILSTEALCREAAMPSFGLVFPFMLQAYPASVDMIFEDSVSTDVVFLWQDNTFGDGKISRLYAHQAILHQHHYFREKLCLTSRTDPASPSPVSIPRKLLVRDFALPLFRAVLRWIYTRTIDVPTYPEEPPEEGPVDSIEASTDVPARATNQHLKRLRFDIDADIALIDQTVSVTEQALDATLVDDDQRLQIDLVQQQQNHQPIETKSNASLDPRKAPTQPFEQDFTWVDVYQLADNFMLQDLRNLALENILRLVRNEQDAAGLLKRFRTIYPEMKDALVRYHTCHTVVEYGLDGTSATDDDSSVTMGLRQDQKGEDGVDNERLKALMDSQQNSRD
ncbi:hypothetical protein BG011_001553 [Mortierella polycephala]|uniref:BTB domain-containing protein n=1 Tax=Mortierella polycephala TaxID=41804 RepID=A0A9P6Q599_9FUNG|nr:hypothetical protein BG011_001553 [Mortierella polycephala]